MKDKSTDKVTIFTAQQNQQHKQCYNLETSTSLKILRSLQTSTSVGNVCQENLSNLNKAIDRKVVEIYVKEKQNQGFLTSFLQLMFTRQQNPVQMEFEQHQNDSSEEWQPDDDDNDVDETDSFQQQ
ncbi:unnamed protein product [Paramecium pentaurelia]|uniref:Uncharacterized protein n=1 Tax=Paramecium pentaurelia TaxID=43138 RepID=A0A8S1T7Z2_9CILI|nr:unnamed protein product [Paramecium pentaurelia]